MEDEYCQPQALPNVDFYPASRTAPSVVPVNLFTGGLPWPARLDAQLNEMISDPEYKIGRPRQLFTGSHAATYNVDRFTIDPKPALCFHASTGLHDGPQDDTFRSDVSGFSQAPCRAEAATKGPTAVP